MTILQYHILLSALMGVAVAGVAWYCLRVARQITYVTLADGRRKARSLPLLFRLMLPLAPNITPLFRQAGFSRIRERTQRKIVAAGFDALITGEELWALRVLFAVLLGALWCLAVIGAFDMSPFPILKKVVPFLCVLGPVLLAFWPGAWLKRMLTQRHTSIRRSLPFVLDLLTLSVEAGMDFMSALQRSVDLRPIDALGEELIRVVREIQLGRVRRHALRDMAVRVDLTEMRSVVNALVQADELGVSIGAILRIQSNQMRQRRFEYAERLANEAPVKMLFPLMAFIFPAVFLILLGPIVVDLAKQAF